MRLVLAAVAGADLDADGPAAAMLLRILAARGFEIPERVHKRVLECTDLGQLEAWADAAVKATSVDDVFSG
jgi:hypothetical protein